MLTHTLDTQVTSNDSRVRMYDLRDLTLTCKYKGLTNFHSQNKATFSHDCKYIICGSEDKAMYLWPTHHEDVTKMTSLRRDRNEMWESIRCEFQNINKEMLRLLILDFAKDMFLFAYEL